MKRRIFTLFLAFHFLHVVGQKVGINTVSPQAPLHVRDVFSGGIFSPASSLILEKNSNSYIQFSNPNSFTAGILSGNELGSNRSSLLFLPDSSISLHPGIGFGTATNFLKNGFVGIGTSAPKARLHIKDGNTLSNPASDAFLVIEDFQSVSLNFLTSNVGQCAIYFGSDSPTNGAILYNASGNSLGLSFRTNTVTRAVIDNGGDLGIGDLTPNARLHVSKGTSGSSYHGNSAIVVEDDVAAYIQFTNPSASEAGFLSSTDLTTQRSGLIFRADSSVQIRAGGNLTKMHIDASGNVGIGTTSPSKKLHVVGDICATGTIGACSDIRYKKDFLPLQHALEKVNHLQALYYYWDTEKFDSLGFTDQRQMGVIAQEVEKDFPEIVMTDDQGYKAVDYSRLSVVLLAALKEQQVLIDAQEKRFQAMEIQLALLKEEIQMMKSGNSNMGHQN